MMIINSVLFGLTAAAGLAAAAPATVAARQDVPPSSCESTVTDILSNPTFNCIAPKVLKLVLFPDNTNISVSSMEATMDSWLSSMCASDACSAETITQLANKVSTGCGATFGGVPLAAPLASLVSFFTTNYPIARQTMCLKNTVTSQTCLTGSFLNSINSTSAFLDASIFKPVDKALMGIILVGVFNIDCNDCTKATFQIYNKAFPDVESRLAGVCGANFMTGISIPPAEIKQTAINVQAAGSPGVGAPPASGTAATPDPSSTKKGSGAGTLAAPAAGILFAVSAFMTLL